MTDYSTLLRDHVTLTCRSIDRIFLQAYVPKLQTVGWVCQFLRWQRGYPIPSSAAFGKIGAAYVAEVHRFAKANGIPVFHFAKGENKEEIARPLIEAAAAGRERSGGADRDRPGEGAGVAVVEGQGTRTLPHPHMEWGRQMAFVNHFYFYLWDPEWGGAFWKTNAYAPYPIWIWLNGHDWAKRQCEKAGIGYTALDNGFRDCDDPAAAADLRPARPWRGEELLLALAASAALPVHPRLPRDGTSTNWRFASSRSPTPGSLTGPRPDGPSSSRSSATISTSAGPLRWR